MIQQPTQTEPSESSSSDDVFAVLVPPTEVAAIESIIRPILERSVDKCFSRVRVDYFFSEAKQNQMQIWLALTPPNTILAVAVTQIAECDGRKFCMVIQTAGTQMERWVHLLVEVEKWAAELGCQTIEIEGRRGWGRIFKDYRESYRVFAKELRQ